MRARSVVTLTCVLAVAGCTGGSPDATTPTASGGSSSSSGVATTSRTFELAGFSPLTADVPDEPVGAVPSSLPGTQLEVYLAQREGEAVTVVFGLRQTKASDSPVSVGVQLGEGFIDYTVGGVSLLDPAGLKQYLTLRPQGAVESGTSTTNGPCACSSTRGGRQLAVDDVAYYAASIAAPPASATKVSFVTPVGTVPGLTLTDG